VLYYAFDCLWLDGVGLRPLGLLDRKRVLRHVLKSSKPAGVFYADHVEQAGTGLFKAVCQKDCEGIVAKHRLAPYVTRLGHLVQSAQSGLYAKTAQARDVRQIPPATRARNDRQLGRIE